MKVHDAEFPDKDPIFPHELYAPIPRLGLEPGRVAGLSGPLEKEFKPEKLRLSQKDILQASPSGPEAMTALVYKRIQPVSQTAIKSMIAKVKKSAAQKNLASEIQDAFRPHVRRILTKKEIDGTRSTEQLQEKIEAAFTRQNRLVP